MSYDHKYGRCYMEHVLKMCFVAIPKNASSSVRVSLGMNPADFGNLQDLSECQLKNYATFTILREPNSRLISGFNELLRRAKKDGQKTMDYSFWTHRDDKAHSFKLFIRAIYNQRDGLLFDNHIQRQDSFFVEGLDYYFNFHKLNQQFEHVFGVKLPRENESKEEDRELWEVLQEPKYRVMVESIYSNDFKLYEKYRDHIEVEKI